MKEFLRFLLVPALLCFAVPCLAIEAVDCISVSQKDQSQVLTNKCTDPIEVAWCHTRDEQSYQVGLCGRKDRYYQQHVVLQPGESKDNKYTLPLHSNINYAACFGGYNTLKQTKDGQFFCK